MKSVLPFRGDDTLMYSITYDLSTPESRRLGSFEESGYIVEPTEGELQDILLQANRDYGIYMPVGVGSFANPIAPEDNDYFTKGHEKYYTLFINKTDGSRLNQEELDFVTALLNEGKYSFDEDSNRFYEWGGTPEFGIGGWIGGTLIGGFLGYQVGKAVGYGRAVQGYAGGGEVSNEEYQMVVNHWVYFTFNYPMGFLEKSFGTGVIANHLQGKFSSFYERYGANAVMPKFWSELDSGNQRKLSDFVKNNYVNSQEQFEKLKNVSDENYSNIVNHWTMFGFNYPSEWLKKVFNNNTDHYKSKFSRAYQRAGSLGAMNMFYTELDGGNQSILAEWVMKNYSGTKLEQGGSTYEDGGSILEVEGGSMDLSNKEKVEIYKWIENSPIFTSDIQSNEYNDFDLEQELSKKFNKTSLQSKSIIKGYEISRGYSKAKGGSTYQGGGEIDSKKIGVAKRLKIKNWYLKNYPTDDLGNEIDENISFWSLYIYLKQRYNVYSVLAVSDSLVRERVFEKLSEIIGVEYNDIYNLWLKSDKYSKGGSTYKDEDFEYSKGGGVSELEIGNEVELELNNGKTIKGKVEKINPLKIRTDATSTQVIPNALIKNIKKYAKGGSTYSDGGGVAKSVWEKNGFIDIKRDYPREWEQVEWSLDGHSLWFIGKMYYSRFGLNIEKENGEIFEPKDSHKLFWRKINEQAKGGSTYADGGDIPEGFHQMPDGTIMPDSAHYGLGGLLLAGGFGAYVGYKIGRAKPKKKGFQTEKKIARKIKSKAKELTSKNKYAGGGSVVYFDDMSKEDILSQTVVYDNEGETYDRYTVFTPDGSVFGMSENARGFNQFVGDESEIEQGTHLGKKLKSVPKEIEYAVLERMTDDDSYADGGGIEFVNQTDFSTEGDYDLEIDDFIDKLKIIHNHINFDEVAGESDSYNTDLTFFKNSKSIAYLVGSYNEKTERYDSEFIINDYSTNINFHPYNSMGGIDLSEFDLEIKNAVSESKTYSAVVSVEGYEVEGQEFTDEKRAETSIKDLKEKTHFNLVRGKKFGQGKRVEQDRVLNKYADGGGVNRKFMSGGMNDMNSFYEIAEKVAKRFDKKEDAQNWINENSKYSNSKFRIEEVPYDSFIDYRVMEKYERRKMADGGGVENAEMPTRERTITRPTTTPTEKPTKPDKNNPYKPKVKPRPKADYLITNK